MEDEIKPREFLNLLLEHWRWISALTLIAAAAAFALSSLAPTRYTSTATLAIIKPSYLFRLDADADTEISRLENEKAYLGLALSDGVLTQLLHHPAGRPALGKFETLTDLRKILSATAGLDPSLMVFSATDGDPQRAAQIANAWAELYVDYIKDVFSQNSANQAYFAASLPLASERLDRAETDLAAFQSTNLENILEVSLTARLTALNDFLAARQSLELVMADAISLHQQLAALPPDAPPSPGDDLAGLLTGLNSLSKQDLPLQITLPADGGSLNWATAGELAAYLNHVITALETKSLSLLDSATALEPEILSLQQQLTATQAERGRLELERDLAQAGYATMSQILQELTIAVDSGFNDVSLVSRASMPTSKASPKRIINTALAGAAGLLFSIITLVGWTWWTKPRTDLERSKPTESVQGQ